MVNSTKQRILVIEDESSIREIITEMLEDEDFEVSCAENGQQGLELVHETHPDLIICDVMMPLMHGYDVLSHLRSEEKTAIIPFIFLTAKADKSHLRIGMNLGADDYLTKPFTQSELIHAVHSRLDRQAGMNQHFNHKLEELRRGVSSALPHELLSPVNGLVGLSEYLASKYDSIDPTELLEIAQLINKSAWRFDRVVQNTLLYTKLALAEERQAILDLQETCDYSLLTVKDTAIAVTMTAKRHPDLKLTLENGNVCISMKNLRKIVEELVDNACKFSAPNTPINLLTSIQDGFFYLVVEDQGYGILPDQLSEIGAYKKFTSNYSGGFGLGLIIVQQLTELYRGEFSITSVPEQGTRVQIKLPVIVEDTHNSAG